MWVGDAVDASNLCCDSQGKIQSVTLRCSISVCPQVLLVVSWWWDGFMGVWFDQLKHQGKVRVLGLWPVPWMGKVSGNCSANKLSGHLPMAAGKVKNQPPTPVFVPSVVSLSSQSSPSAVSISGLGQLRLPTQRVPNPTSPVPLRHFDPAMPLNHRADEDKMILKSLSWCGHIVYFVPHLTPFSRPQEEVRKPRTLSLLELLYFRMSLTFKSLVCGPPV